MKLLSIYKIQKQAFLGKWVEKIQRKNSFQFHNVKRNKNQKKSYDSMRRRDETSQFYNSMCTKLVYGIFMSMLFQHRITSTMVLSSLLYNKNHLKEENEIK